MVGVQALREMKAREMFRDLMSACDGDLGSVSCVVKWLDHSLAVPVIFFGVEERKEMFYLTTHSTHFFKWLYSVRHMVKDHSDSERKHAAATWATRRKE